MLFRSQSTWVRFLGWEDPLEKEMATHSGVLAWKIPWTEEPGRLQSMGSLRVRQTERLHFHFSLSCIGEGKGNPLQCFCLENPRDGGAWWAAVYGVAHSWTRLKQLSNSSSFDLTFQVPCNIVITASDLTSITFYIHNCTLFLLWLCLFILSEVISPLFSSSILGTYQPGEFIFQCHIFLPFHTVDGVLKARILKWFSIPFFSGPRFVRTGHHDPSILGGPTRHGS